MKKYLLMFVLALLLPTATWAQITDYVVIGTKTQTTYQAPFNNYYKMSWNEHIYPKSSFTGPCTIYSISYNCGAAKTYTMSEFKIYMSTTNRSQLAGDADWTPEEQLTLVYDHQNVVIGAATGWQEFILDTPFLYDGTQNLVIVTAKQGTSNNSTLKYYFSNTTYSMAYRQSKTDVTFSQHPGTNAGTRSNFRANIKIGVGPYLAGCEKPTDLVQTGASAHSVTFSWTPADDTEAWDVYMGEIPTDETVPTASAITETSYTFSNLDPATQYFCYVRTNCGDGDVSEWQSIATMTDPDFTGDGSAEAPYLIYSIENLNTLHYAMMHEWKTYQKHFRLMNDLATVTSPIGTDNVSFRGEFDGNGHTITLDLEGEQYLALFARLSVGANIHDLNIDGHISGNNNYSAGICSIISDAGSVLNENIVISNCTNYAQIDGFRYSGGIVGYALLSRLEGRPRLIIENCTNRGNITCENGFVGGIIGGANGGTTIDGCSNRAPISASNDVGGIFGEVDYSIVKNCFNRANLTSQGNSYGESHIGGIGGTLYSSQLFNCASVGDISGFHFVGSLLGDLYVFGTDDVNLVQNVYATGQVTFQDGNFYGGAMFGSITANDYTRVVIDRAYYEEGMGTQIWGGGATGVTPTNLCTFAPMPSDPLTFILSENVGGTDNMRTAMNQWATANSCTVWYKDTYHVNSNYPTLGLAQAPGIAINPTELDMYYRPIGAKMAGETITVTNTADDAVVLTLVDFTNSPFFMLEGNHIQFPLTLQAGISKEFAINTNPNAIIEEGEQIGAFVAMWNQRNIETATVNAIAYQPVTPDVFELAQMVEEMPFSTTQNTSLIKKNYNLPGEGTTGPDGVYKLTFTEDVMLTASITEGDNPRIALYAEDFGGLSYPDAENYIAYSDTLIEAQPLAAGTYYLVASSTSSLYTIDINTDEMPLPAAPTLVSPTDGATGIEAPIQLRWESGQYTTAYQVLFGTTNPPTEVLQDWTNELTDVIQLAELNHNTTYYWQVIARNTTGDVEGPVWSFTAVLNKPRAFAMSSNKIYEGETAQMHWTAPNREFLGYNVYQDGVQINETLVTETNYSVEGLTYNMGSGYNFAVTAVYEEGESGLSNTDYVRVTGNGMATGHVYEIDSITPIANVTITMVGTDEFNAEQTYTLTTNADGEATMAVKAGTYRATAVKDGYRNGACVGIISIAYDQETEFVITLRETIIPVGQVVAEVIDDDNVEVTWTWEEGRSFNHYNLYRTSCVDSTNVVLVAEGITEQSYIDEEFGGLNWGTYKYGVSAYYEGNRGNGKQWEKMNPELAKLTATTCPNNAFDGNIMLNPSFYTRGAQAYASVPSNPSYGASARYISYDVETPANTNVISSTYDITCGAYAGEGYYYAYDQYCYFYKFDYLTGECVSRIYAGCFFLDMTYDYTTHTMFGTYNNELWTINLTTGEPTFVGSMNVLSMQVIACNLAGEMYGIEYSEENAQLYSIDKTTAQITAIGATGQQCMYLQSGGFDLESNTLYWAGHNSSSAFFAEVNINNGHATVYAQSGSISEQMGWFIPYNDPNPVINESTIVWSNCVEKDMDAIVEVTVTTNNSEGPENTYVLFESTDEPGIVYETTLDESGSVVWGDFRKGHYEYTISKDGFNSCAYQTAILIDHDMTIECELEEMKATVDNLYVSHTGWMTWDNPNEQPYLEGDEFYFNFEDGTLNGFTLIDADGDGYNWMNSRDFGLQNGHESNYCITSQSYDNEAGALHPNNFIITDQKYLIGSTSELSWYVCAQDQAYMAEHYALVISTAEHPSPDDFIAVFEETITNKSAKGENSPRGTRDQGIWHRRTIDISTYSGQEVWIAFRHFNCTDKYMIDIDDFRLSNVRNNNFILEGFKVYQDNQLVAETTDNYFQLDVDGLTDGEKYLASVEAVYETGTSDKANFIWKYRECSNFEGIEEFTGEVDGTDIILNWSGIPTPDSNRDGEWFYYDQGNNDGGLGTGSKVFWAIEIPTEELAPYTDYMLTKLSMFDTEAYQGEFMIYEGGENAPGDLIYEQTFECKGTHQYLEFQLNEPVAIDITKNLWIVASNINGNYVIPYQGSWHTWRGSMISFDGNQWQDISNLGYFLTWNLRAYIEENTWNNEVRGLALYRDEVCLTPEFLEPTDGTYVDNDLEEGTYTYGLRVVYGEQSHNYNWNSMSCPEEVTIEFDPTEIEEGNANGISLYPNPTNGSITIEAIDMRNIVIVNALGQVVYDTEVNSDNAVIDMAQFGFGIYMVKVYTETGVTVTKVNVR